MVLLFHQSWHSISLKEMGKDCNPKSRSWPQRRVTLMTVNKGEGGRGRMMRAWGQQARNSLEMNANRNLVETQDPKLLLTHPLPHTLIHTHFGIILCNVLFIWISLRMQRSFEFHFHNLLSCAQEWLKSCYSFCTQRRCSINTYWRLESDNKDKFPWEHCCNFPND